MGGRPFSTVSGWEIRPTGLPGKVRKEITDYGVRAEWLDGGAGPMLRPGTQIEVLREPGKPIRIRSFVAPSPEKAGIRQVVALAGGGWDPNPPADGFNVAEGQAPVVTLPAICIAPDTVETSVRVLGEALAQRGLVMPADRFATLCRMAAEMVTLEKRAGLSGTLQELVTRRVNEILEMVVKGV